MKNTKKTIATRPLIKSKDDSLSIDKSLCERLNLFFEQHPAHRLSTNLRRLLLDFLMFDGAIEVNYLNDLLYDLEGLFELLELAKEKKAT